MGQGSAAESAESYVSMSNFSHKSLTEQLEFEGFTSKQAAYGVKSVGL
jgi:colicin import membrane protein